MRSRSVLNGSIEPRNRPTARIEASHVSASLKRLPLLSLGKSSSLSLRLGFAALAQPCCSLALGRGRPRTRCARAERQLCWRMLGPFGPLCALTLVG